MSKLLSNIRSIRAKYRIRREKFLAQLMVNLSAFPGKMKLSRRKPLRILIDNSVLRHGLTHTNEWISTGTKLWGEKIQVDTGYRARVPRNYSPNHRGIYEDEVPYFASLAHLAAKKYIQLHTSRQLAFERLRQPNYNRFQFGFNVWSKIDIQPLPKIPGTNFFSSIITPEWYSKESQIKRLLIEADADFLKLVQGLPEKDLLDFYHVWTAKHGGCSIFLTTDKRLRKTINSLSAQKKEMFRPVRVLFPSELGKELGLHPVGHKFLTPIDADWFYVIR